MLRNTLTANDKYLVRDCENLQPTIQTQLSKKRITFSDFVVPFLESKSNFKQFKKKYDRHSYFISEITDSERLDYTTL